MSTTEAAPWWTLRGLYDWTLSWADSPHGLSALALLAFAESSFFPIPPDILLIALVLGAPTRWWRLAAVCTTASVIGGMAGYGIGVGAWDAIGEPIVRFYNGQEAMAEVRRLYEQWGFLGIFAAALSPIPYKVFTIGSGVMGYPFGAFLVASVLGRATRFFAVALLLKRFGPPIRTFIDRWFNALALLFALLLAGGFLVLKVFANH